MAIHMQQRRDTALNWVDANPVLGDGELGLETDTRKLKCGDGVRDWVQLPYLFPNLPVAGTTGQVLAKTTNADYDTTWETLTATNTGADPAGAAAAAQTTAETYTDTQVAPRALDSAVVHNTGNETVAGTKTFSTAPTVPDGSFSEAKVANLTTDLAGKAPAAGPFAPSLTGATAASRYVGATASGAPVSGTFAAGDFVVDQTGTIWICTTGGTPGTWTKPSSSSGPPTGNAGGDLTGTYPSPTLAASGATAGSVGDATHVPAVTVDAKGRVTTGPTSTAIALAASGDATGTLPGALTLATANSSPGTTGDATHTSVVTTDAKGRVTANTSTAIQVTESQVTNLTADLAGRVAKDTQVWASRDHGVLGDGRDGTTGAITSGSAVVTDTNANFTSADVGKHFIFYNALSSTGDLITTIASYQSATQVTLAATADTTVTSGSYTYMSDDYTALATLINTAGAGAAILIQGICGVSASLGAFDNQRIFGGGRSSRLHDVIGNKTILDISNTTGVEVHSLAFGGCGQLGIAGRGALKAAVGVTAAKFHDLWIENVGTGGIVGSGWTNSTVSNVYIANTAEHGMYLSDGVTNVAVVNPVIINAGGHHGVSAVNGIKITGISATITNPIVDSALSSAITHDRGGHSTIIGGILNGSGAYGIRANTGCTMEATGVRITNSTTYGIYDSGSAGFYVQGCTFNEPNATNVGFFASNANAVTVKDATVQLAKSGNFAFSVNGANTLFYGASISNSCTHGISIAATASNTKLLLVDNNATTTPLSDSGTGTVVVAPVNPPSVQVATVTSTGSWTAPLSGIVRMIAVGGGGGGGGGGADALTSGTNAQVGGGAGGAGAAVERYVTVAAGAVYDVVIGAGGGGATGGTASTDTNGHAGATDNVDGAVTTITRHTGTVLVCQAMGGTKGISGGAKSTTVVGGGGFGSRSVNMTMPGQGGFSAGSGNGGIGYMGGGGGGGGAATALLGGGAGGVGTTTGLGGVQGSSGASATTTGASASAAAANSGAGGGGGGGGAPGGAGGNGGAGGSGVAVFQYVG